MKARPRTRIGGIKHRRWESGDLRSAALCALHQAAHEGHDDIHLGMCIVLDRWKVPMPGDLLKQLASTVNSPSPDSKEGPKASE